MFVKGWKATLVSPISGAAVVAVLPATVFRLSVKALTLWSKVLMKLTWLTVAFGLLGFMDDYYKVTKRTSDGLSGRARLLIEFAVAGLATWLIMRAENQSISGVLAIPFIKTALLPLGLFFILVGGFVFAADLVRALSNEGVHLEVEMLWLRSYGDKRVANAVSMIAGPSEQIAGRHVLVIDGVLDAGRTVKKAVSLIQAAGAASVRVVAMLDKQRPDRVAEADHVGFVIGNDFVIGYGMDDAGAYRALPYIGRVI